tara:strand:- start:128 stop:511 length:384 start_codon:yes stop_codon:yes gene_type:complete
MNAKDLELKISGLEKAIQEKTADAGRFQDELKETQKQLEDYNKPELSPVVMDQIHDVVETVLNNFNWDESDNYQDLEYEIDYDGRVSLSNISFDTHEIHEKIVDQVCNLFKETDNQVTHATQVEKVY